MLRSQPPKRGLVLLALFFVASLLLGFVLMHYSATAWRYDVELLPARNAWTMRLEVLNLSPLRTIHFGFSDILVNGYKAASQPDDDDVQHGTVKEFDLQVPMQAAEKGQPVRITGRYTIRYQGGGLRFNRGFRILDETVTALDSASAPSAFVDTPRELSWSPTMGFWLFVGGAVCMYLFVMYAALKPGAFQ